MFDSNTLFMFAPIAGEGDVDVEMRTPVALALPDMDTKGPLPDCKLPFPLLTLIASPSIFLCCSLRPLKLFPDRSEISLGGPVTDAIDIFSSSKSTAPTKPK